MFFYVTIYAKEKTTLQNFLVFLSKIKFFTFKFFNQKKNKNKFITILKSPHVNKTAQEQFEFKFFTTQIVLYSLSTSFLCFMILKRVLKKGFPGLKIKLTYNFDKKKQNKILLAFLNPDCVILQNKSTKKKVKTYFLMFDSYGEIYLKKLSIF